MKKLNWVKCKNDSWCKLNELNLNHEHFSEMGGVYIIWTEGNHCPVVDDITVLYVGQGVIADRLRDHLDNKEIQENAVNNLFVTWASVDKYIRDGVESYLAEMLEPILGERHPIADPFTVNLPFESEQ